MPTLILLRHGQSQWNLEDKFTGWVDVDLTPEGEAQAKKGGELIKAAGVAIDRCYTSVLTANTAKSSREKVSTIALC